MGGPLLTPEQVAALLGWHYKTVLLKFRAGELPGYKLGNNTVRFARSDVEAFLDAHRVEAVAQ